MSSPLDAAVGFILQNLKESVQYNDDLIGGVKGNVKELCDDLDTLKAFIKEYTEKYKDNEILEKLANEIRAVVYRAEDAIETYIHCASVQKLRSGFSKTVHLASYMSELKSVGKEIQKVSEEVRNIYSTKAHLGFAAIQIEEIANKSPKKKKRRIHHSFVLYLEFLDLIVEPRTKIGTSDIFLQVSRPRKFFLQSPRSSGVFLQSPRASCVEALPTSNCSPRASVIFVLEPRRSFVHLGALSLRTSERLCSPRRIVLEKLSSENCPRRIVLGCLQQLSKNCPRKMSSRNCPRRI